MPTPTTTTASQAGPEPGSGTRPPHLPWWAFALATVIALVAAATVYQVLDDDDPARPFGPETPGLELSPSGGAPEAGPLSVEVELPDGTSSTLADQLTGPAVVNFFGSWCVPCITEMPEFEAVSVALGDRVQFFGIAVQDRPEDAAGIVARTGVTYGWARDVTGDLVGAVGVVQMPTTIFVDADGEIVASEPGAVDAAGLRELLAQHLGIAT